MSEGISSLIDGNLPGLFANVTHGVSDSTAKVMGSVSDVVGLPFDNKHEQKRREIREQASGPWDSLKAGGKGLGHGLWGGVKGVIDQPIKGYKENRVGGALIGIGAGVYGLLAKPMAGVLDFATGGATAVREFASSKNEESGKRIRLPRCCTGPAGLLPAYDRRISAAQQILFSLNNNRYNER